MTEICLRSKKAIFDLLSPLNFDREDLPKTSKSSPILLCFALLLGVAILTIDYMTGPLVHFRILLVLPVSFVAAYNGIFPALVLSFLFPIIRMSFHFEWETPVPLSYSLINAGITIFTLCIFSIVAWLYTQTIKQLKILRGILPICSYCKRIRNESGEWAQMEDVISSRSEAMFSHGLCPDCLQKFYGNIKETNSQQ